MREADPREREMGMQWYVSDADGTGGELRFATEDFVVRERERFDVDRHPVDADTGAYPHLVFRATLREWDTNDFAGALSDRLGMSRERVSWAGTKDKHAVTTQLFSVRYDGEDLPTLRGAEVEVLGRAGRPVLFGDLAGNAFEIRVRDADHPEHADAITDALRAFAAGDAAGGTDGEGDPSPDDAAGVPNYFGHQRFGSYRPVTHRAGLAVVRQDWADAVMTYVTRTTPEEPADTREARESVAGTRDWSAALERLPGKLHYERAMVHTLAERVGEGEPTDEDWRAALESLPSNLQTMLVNAAQSYAFNLMLSERLERGLPFDRATAGDVVCFADQPATAGVDSGSDSADDLALPDTDRLQRVDEGRVDAVNRHCERGRAFVTAPLVGTETDLADGVQGDIERDVLDDLGLEPGDFDLPGAFESAGTRRAILLRTDLDVARVDDDPDSLWFRFALPKGSYATVVLREYLKDDPLALT